MSQTMITRIGWGLSGLYATFMLGASVAPKLLGLAVADETLVALGWVGAPILLIGVLELVCTLLYLWPRTSVLGGVLTMAILGGAMATHLRAGSPLASHTLFSLYLGLAMWGGLWLRSPALRTLFPLTRA